MGVAAALEDLLEKEHQALLDGELSEVERLGREKLDLLERVAVLPIEDLTMMKHLRVRLIRNQLLAQSAIEGMRRAISRAIEIADVADGLRTYDQAGRKSLTKVRSGDALSKRS